MKIYCALAVVVLISCYGCRSVKNGNGVATEEVKMSSFRDAMRKDFHPRIGERFEHNGDGVEVFQVLDSEGFVLANVLDKHYEHRWLVARIDTDNEYVKGEYVMPGMLEFVGTYTYETAPVIDGVQKVGQNTVRRFKEIQK